MTEAYVPRSVLGNRDRRVDVESFLERLVRVDLETGVRAEDPVADECLRLTCVLRSVHIHADEFLRIARRLVNRSTAPRNEFVEVLLRDLNGVDDDWFSDVLNGLDHSSSGMSNFTR